MKALKPYRRPVVTTVEAATILNLLGPAQASPSVGNSPTPYSALERTGSGSSGRFDQN